MATSGFVIWQHFFSLPPYCVLMEIYFEFYYCLLGLRDKDRFCKSVYMFQERGKKILI